MINLNRGRYRPVLMLALAFLFLSSYAESGEALCVQPTVSDRCKLAWSFLTDPKAHYRIERLDPVTGNWRAVATVEMQVSGSSNVEGGFLYHVRGCNIGARNMPADCAASNSVWVPVFPYEDDIPAEVIGVNGETMSVSKNDHLAIQTEQYNMYLLVRTLDMVNLTTLPPMKAVTEKDILADGKWTLPEGMQKAFYEVFTAKQAHAIASLESTTVVD